MKSDIEDYMRIMRRHGATRLEITDNDAHFHFIIDLGSAPPTGLEPSKVVPDPEECTCSHMEAFHSEAGCLVCPTCTAFTPKDKA